MSFADDVRKNYVPKKENKPVRNDQNLVRIVAAGCIKQIKPLLMQQAKSGKAERTGVGALGFTKKVVKVRIPAYVDKRRYSCTQITYDSEEGKFYGLGVPNVIALHQILSELRSQCSAEGIHVDHNKGMYNDDYFLFWIEV